MFDRTALVVQPCRTEYVTKTIIEKRAPTDESVRLLKEIEREVRAEIIDSVRVGDTTFECVIHQSKSFASQDITHLAVFSLNGKKMTAEHIQPMNGLCDKPYDRLKNLRDAVAVEIANHILNDALFRMEK